MRIWLFVAFLAAGPAFAASNATEDLAEYQASMSVSLKDGAVILAEPFGKAYAFSTGTQTFSPAAAKGLLGFNVGLGAGVNNTPIDKGSNNKAASSLPASLPMPMAQLNAHLGLPGFLIFESTDVGLRLGSISAAASEITINMSSFGAEFRGNVFEAGLVSPVTLTLGLSYDQLRSEIGFRKTSTLNDISNGYTRTGTVEQGSDVKGTLSSTMLRATVSRKLLFFTPYLGAGLQMMGGETTMSAFQRGSVTSSNGGPSATATLLSEGKASKAAPISDVRLAAGFEISLFVLYLSLGGEYGLQSGGSGGNGQIGLQF